MRRSDCNLSLKKSKLCDSNVTKGDYATADKSPFLDTVSKGLSTQYDLSHTILTVAMETGADARFLLVR